MDKFIGMNLGRYHILEQLGEGGMATVYKAYDTRLERDIAIKVLRMDQFAPAMLERILKRFEREAKALARLTHPNIVHVNDYGEQNGIPYLVMDYLPGGTLKSYLGTPMPWQEATRLLLPIAQALDYAHEEKILHRDVKPSNILLTVKGQPMLSDFGIAKILDLEDGQTLTGTGVGIGTPEYMSPEQGLGMPVDSRTDIYSLGVVLYELITGRKPYSAETPMAVVYKHLNDPLPRPRQFVPALPEEVEKVLLKALAKQPEDRYPGMGDFARALDGLLMMDGTRDMQTILAAPAVPDVRPSTGGEAARLSARQEARIVPPPAPAAPPLPPVSYAPPYPAPSTPYYPVPPVPMVKKPNWKAPLVTGVVLFSLGVLLLLLFTVAQLYGSGGPKSNLTGFMYVMLLCPTPLTITGAVLWIIGSARRRRSRLQDG